ncbi:MAG: leucine-rich repeat protein [Saccharofermentans sp.]|nr:leucine-rich repeat protein [Saccharofermentans sp.]
MINRTIRILAGVLISTVTGVALIAGGNQINADTEAIIKGEIGEDLIYIATDIDGDAVYDVLHVQGLGNMYDFNSPECSDYVDRCDYISDDVIASIEEVVIDDGVTSVGCYFLYDAVNVKKVSIPDSVEIVGEGAFVNNAANRKLFISGDSPVSVDMYSQYTGVFFTSDYSGKYGSNIKYTARDANRDGKYDSVVLVGSGDIADRYDENFNKIDGCNFPDFIKTTVSNVFIPYGVKSIGNYAFSDFTSLRKITLPITLESIETGAFENCGKLPSINVPDSVTTIGDLAFAGCDSFTVLNLPSSLKILGDDSIPLNKDLVINGRCIFEQSEAITVCLEANLNITYNYTHNPYTPPTIPPTCTERGRLNSTYCLDCNKMLRPGTSIPAIGHLEFVEPMTYPGCVETGLRNRTICERCNEVLYEGDIIPPIGHSGSVVNKEPTCMDDGYNYRIICTRCNEVSFWGEIIPATGHVYIESEGTKPTCTNLGNTGSKICSICGYVGYPNMPLPALGHNEVPYGESKDATCTEDGLKAGVKCDRCELILQDKEVIPAKGHTEVIDIAIPATDTKGGYTEGIHCSVCKLIIKAQVFIPPVAKPTPTPETGVEGFCERLYTIALGRSSDPKGKSEWASALREGSATGEKVAYGFFFSPEFTGKELDNKEYVTRLYRTFMDREPDPAGFNDWVKALDDGASRLQVFNGFVKSPEFVGICERFGIIAF